MADFHSYSTVHAHISGRVINVALGEHWTRVSFLLELISGAYPASHSWFELREDLVWLEGFCWRFICYLLLPLIMKEQHTSIFRKGAEASRGLPNREVDWWWDNSNPRLSRPNATTSFVWLPPDHAPYLPSRPSVSAGCHWRRLLTSLIVINLDGWWQGSNTYAFHLEILWQFCGRPLIALP